ncbi:DDB1- and CUL4-associated factor 15 [Dufourea novaeangliae]|uniref:DDB1-and CUL4-associated factor 15 n=1 Tax=Dufourea novaeangliae TaxID=178035 RepID=A0A154PHQ3_DUFNO|nr:DDB1- and CUL4-associated factor 15 [Dufourea novaeangliae]
MADASSSDTTSDCCNEWFSDITSERSEYVIVGQKPCLSHRRSKRHFLQKLFLREVRGCLSAHNYASEERLFATVPSWRHLPLLHVIPKSALEAGHIVMGLTQCGQFLLTYTYTMDVSGNTSLYKYLLHWWAFTPNHVVRKVAEVTLFGNYTIYRELSIVISQWPMERNKLVIHGLCTNWLHLQPTDRAYLTITTVPSLENCKDCLKVAASYEEEGEELAANWDGCVRCNCLQHGLTVHTTYEVISPYPRFRATVCLNYWNHVVVNTGNFLHVLRVDLDIPRSKNQKSCDKQDTVIPDTVPLDMSDVEELDYTKVERYESSDEKLGTPECAVDRSPRCESSIEHDFLDELIRIDDKLTHDPSNTSNSNQSDCVCDIRKSADIISVKSCECTDIGECRCLTTRPEICRTEQQAISVRDKILQDFCEDMSQELNIGSDLITLVKHPSCSPRSTPQRLPSDLRTTSCWSSPILTPPSDILKTRNSESSHRSSRSQRSNSPQPGASEDNNVTSVNSPLHSVSMSPSSSSRLMSPPVSRSFRHPSPRKRSNLHSPPPIVNTTQSRTRATHKLILEAEKAYEFTDEAQETCEKLSSFRKRRLADKKYEFCDETEDAENIVPFKHIRDQFRHRGCSIHQIPSSPTMSPVLPNGKKHWVDSDQSETDDFSINQDIGASNDVTVDSAEKNVLRPLNQNQLPNGAINRDRVGKHFVNSSPLVPKINLQYPTIKCTAHFKRSYIELDDEMISVITDVEDEETGGYVSYQCVLPMHVHGSGYVQMQMISNSKAEKLIVPCVSINQLSFDIETFSHHIADWICMRFKKRYWHCSDYDIEIIDICALSGDIICLLIMKIQASEISNQTQCSQERKQYEVGCKFTWNIDTSEYRITDILPMEEVKPESWKPNCMNVPNFRSPLWNPTRRLAPKLREKIQQPYSHTVRFLHNEMTLAGESITRLYDLDNLVEFYITPMPNYTSIE